MVFYITDIPGVQWWVKPQQFALLGDGDPVTFWPDEGNQQANLNQPVSANAPTYALDSVNGFPAVEFNGTDQWLEGLDGNDFLSETHLAIVVSLLIVDVDVEQTIFSAGSNCRLYLNGSGKIVAKNNSDTVQADITVGWHTVAWMNFGLELRIHVDDPIPEQKTGTGNTGGFGTVLVGKDVGGNFFLGKIGEMSASQFGLQQQSFAKTYAAHMRNWLDRTEPIERERDSLSRRLVANQRSRMFITQDVPLRFLDWDLLQAMSLSHHQMPHPSGQGAGFEPWSRGVFNLMERVESVSDYKLSLGLADRKGISRLVWESGQAEFTAAPYREGCAAIMPVRRLFTHQTPLYVKAPSGVVGQVISGLDLGMAAGTMQDPSAVNYLLRSSFQSGDAGITVTGASGSVTAIEIADEGAPKLFGTERDPADQGLNFTPITEHLLRFEAGNPHTADLIAEWPLTVAEEADITSSSVANPTVITSPLAHGLRTGDEITISGHTGSTPDINGVRTVIVTADNTFTIPLNVTVAGTGGSFEKLIQADQGICFSINHLDVVGPLFWNLQNDVDGEYWDDTAKDWDPSLVWNELPFEDELGADGSIPRSRSNAIVWPGSPGQATLQLGLPNGMATDASVIDVYHVQLEDHSFPTTHWPQDGAFVGRRHPVGLTYFENASAIAFNEPVFTIAGRFTPPWDWEDLQKAYDGGYSVHLWKVSYNFNPTTRYWAGGFDATGVLARWFLIGNNGTNDQSAFESTQMPTRGVEIPIIWRMTSATGGELGLPAQTMTVFANGVRGADMPFTILEPAVIPNARVDFNLFGATVRDLTFDYRAWSDEECLAWSVL